MYSLTRHATGLGSLGPGRGARRWVLAVVLLSLGGCGRQPADLVGPEISRTSIGPTGSALRAPIRSRFAPPAAPRPANGSALRVFRVHPFGLSFVYPAQMRVSAPLGGAGRPTPAIRVFALNAANGMSLQRIRLRHRANGTLIASVVATARRTVIPGSNTRSLVKLVRVAGLPAVNVAVTLGTPPGGRLHSSLIFARRVEYVFTCTAAPPFKRRLFTACRRALDTMRRVP